MDKEMYVIKKTDNGDYILEVEDTSMGTFNSIEEALNVIEGTSNQP